MATGALKQAGEQAAARQRGQRRLRQSLNEYGRGIAGGLIFSLPLIYTQEVWQLGASLGPLRLLLGMLVGFLLLVVYNRYTGLRRDATLAEVLIDSVEELGIGLVVAAVALWLVGEFQPGLPLGAAVGAVALEGIMVAVGVSVGTAQLGGDDDMGSEAEQGEDAAGVMKLLGLSICGAVLIAANVAPTGEVLQIAAVAGAPSLLVLMALALGLTAIICFYSDFSGSARPQRPSGVAIARETVITYAVALAVAAALLWFFGRLEGVGPVTAAARIVVLSAPAALGASAGRLLLQAK